MIQMLANCESFLQTWKNCHVVDTEAVKNTKFNIRNTKVNNLEKKICDATTLIYINQYNTDKKKQKKNRYEWFSAYSCS